MPAENYQVDSQFSLEVTRVQVLINLKNAIKTSDIAICTNSTISRNYKMHKNIILAPKKRLPSSKGGKDAKVSKKAV